MVSTQISTYPHQPGCYPKSEAGKFAYLGRNRVFRQESRRPTVDRAFVPDAIEQQPIANCQGQPQLISLPSKLAQTQDRDRLLLLSKIHLNET
ncbi:hypothetical protein [Microcoleus sp. CAWBG58]|uniref:hypothetical protein n=1 Tax=Microcoleus sp. CAWBG58 TaxID=2841651 RepID=UPI0025D74935|nr:hypothetical protein [Microcoleus sp. CAWBG58]